jgi:hypothetical protein
MVTSFMGQHPNIPRRPVAFQGRWTTARWRRRMAWMHPTARFRALVSVALLALLAACPGGDGDEVSKPDEYFWDCTTAPAGVTVYATDETFDEIANKESAGAVKVSDAEAATVMSPAPGGTLSAGTPPAFMLRTPTAALVPPGPGGGCPPGRPRWWQRLSPIGVAHAHCPGVTGDNMLVRVLPSGSSRPIYSALVSVPMFTPGAEKWRAALGGRKGQTVTVAVLRAGLQGGIVTIGPFASSQQATFTVGD